MDTILNKLLFAYWLNGETITKNGGLTLRSERPFTSWSSAQAPVPEKTISANRGLNPANQGIKFVLWLDCVPQNTISTIPGIK